MLNNNKKDYNQDVLKLANYWLAATEFKTFNFNKTVKILFHGNYQSGHRFNQAILKIDNNKIQGDVLIFAEAEKFKVDRSNPPILILSTAKIEKCDYDLIILDDAQTKSNNILGACGLYINTAKMAEDYFNDNSYDLALFKLSRAMTNQAKNRIVQKAIDFEDSFNESEDTEQLLYESILQAYGQVDFKMEFLTLAKRFSYKEIRSLILGNKSAEYVIAALYLGSLSFLSGEKLNILAQSEFIKIKNLWLNSEKTILHNGSLKKSTRPSAHPVHKIFGFIQLLVNTAELGLLVSLLKSFQKIKNFLLLEEDINNKISILYTGSISAALNRQLVNKQLLDLFLQQKNNAKEIKKTLLAHFKPLNNGFLEKDYNTNFRVAIVLSNAILPYFLFWSKKANAAGLGSTIFKYFFSARGEKNDNAKIVTMLNRLGNPNFNNDYAKTMIYSQGMLELYKNICLTYENGCIDCLLSKWLE